jgi:hypothetical protein
MLETRLSLDSVIDLNPTLMTAGSDPATFIVSRVWKRLLARFVIVSKGRVGQILIYSLDACGREKASATKARQSATASCSIKQASLR